MRIKFQGNHTTEEVAASILSILKLFHERYQISNFNDIVLNVRLTNELGEDVEIIDANTSEVLDTFEIYQSSESLQEDMPNFINTNRSIH